MFASGNRAMNVTENIEAGATEDQQVQLAGHMGHEKRTALKHYDKSREVHMCRSKSVTGKMREMRKAALATKAFHGKGALTDSSSDSDSPSQSGESPPRGLPYRASALLDDDVGTHAKGGVPKRSKPSKTGAPQGTPSPTPSGAAGASPEGEVRDYEQEVPAPTNVPHEIEGDDSDDQSDII